MWSNAGISLELSTPALIAKNTFGRAKHLDQTFLDDDKTGEPDPEDIGRAYQADLERYEFPVKIGDANRVFDGVVCYFDADDSGPGTLITQPGKPPPPPAASSSRVINFYRGKNRLFNSLHVFPAPHAT